MKNKTFHKRKNTGGIRRSLCDDICFDRKTDLSYGI